MSLVSVRKERKLTAELVAERLGMSRAHYTHLENGTRAFTEEMISKLALVLEVDRDIISREADSLRLNNLMPAGWISKVKINGKSSLKAFCEYLKTSDRKYSLLSEAELTERFIQFIFSNIEDSLRRELKGNKEIIGFISRKLGHNKKHP